MSVQLSILLIVVGIAQEARNSEVFRYFIEE